MAATYPPSPIGDHFDAGVMARHVADDLASIFGQARRDMAMGEVGGGDGTVTGSASRRPLLALVGTAAIAVMVGGGLIAGNGASGGVAAPDTREVRTAAQPAQPVAALSAATLPAPAIETARVEEVSSTPPTRRFRADMPSPLRPSLVVDADVAPEPAPVETDAVVRQPSIPTPVPVRTSSCVDSDSCADLALAAADRRVAAAYDEAIGAGVRNSDLRDYRAEWVRARGKVAADPQGALRIYSMVAADLGTLARDAATRPDMAWR